MSSEPIKAPNQQYPSISVPTQQWGRSIAATLLAGAGLVILAFLVGCAHPRGKNVAIGAQSEQQRQVQALVYLLHNYTRTSSPQYNDQWKSTIYELIQIGAPAVPDLCATLTNTDHDVTMQSLAFTLRAIGDPRAVPSLIQALPKTATRGSERKTYSPVMREAVIAPAQTGDTRYPLFIFGRSAHEINAALEHLTGHSEGVEHLNEATSKSPKQIAAVQASRRRAADRWQQWWLTHSDDVLKGVKVPEVSVASSTVISAPATSMAIDKQTAMPPAPAIQVEEVGVALMTSTTIDKPTTMPLPPVVVSSVQVGKTKAAPPAPQLPLRPLESEPLTFQGLCVRDDGRPIPGAQVACFKADYMASQLTLLSQTRASEDGRFTLPPVPAMRSVDRHWSYLLLARTHRHGAGWAMMRQDSPVPSTLRLTLGNRGSVSGRILDTAGHPVVNTHVWVRHILPSSSQSHDPRMGQWFNSSAPVPGWETQTDAQGTFTIDGLVQNEQAGIALVHQKHGQQLIDLIVGRSATITLGADTSAPAQVAYASAGTPAHTVPRLVQIARASEQHESDNKTISPTPESVKIQLASARNEPASKENVGWGQPVAGLRCRWQSTIETIPTGTAPHLTIEVENTSEKQIFWECRRQVTWLIAHPRSYLHHKAPMFEVDLGLGAVMATVGEVHRHLNVHRGSMQDGEPRPGFYRLDPGARMMLKAILPWKLVNRGTTSLTSHLARYYQLGWNLNTRQISMTCPTLVLQVNDQ